MAKWANDAIMDAALDVIATATKAVLCSAQPTNYTEANATYALADVVMAGGDFAKANGDTSGRKVTVAQKTAVPIDASGTATHMALIRTADTTLVYVTTVTSQAVTSGNTATFNAWDVEIADPS